MKTSPFTTAMSRLWLAFAIVFAAAAHATVTNVAWYRLGENDPGAASGQVVNSTTIDFIGADNLKRFGNPRYTNNLSSDAKAIGSTLAVLFDGSSQFYSNALVTTARNNFGIEAWVRPLAPVGTYVIAHNGRFAANGWGLVVQVSNDPFLGTVSGYSGELGGGTIVGGKSLRGSGWAHVALVRNNGTSTFYLNGVAAGPTTNVTPATPTIGFAIATTPESPHTDLLPGIVDEVRVFTFAAGQFSTNDLLVNQGVTTLEASSLTSSTATLNGTTTSADLPTTAWFEWGTDPTNLVNATSPQLLGSNFAITNFSDTITGVTAGVTYYFHAVATNSLKTFFGSLKSIIVGPTLRFWTGKAGVEWSNGANWLPAQGVQPGDDLVFVSALTTNFISSNDIPGIAINSIQIYAPMNLSGASLTVTNGITSAASDAAFVECPIVLGGDQEFSGDQSPILFNGPIDLNGHNLTFNAIATNGANILVQNVISGAGNIVKNGVSGMLWDGAPNTFMGTLRVQDGLTSLEKSGFMGAVSNRLEILGPGRVQFGQSEQLFSLCDVQIETGGQLLLNGFSQTLAGDLILWDNAVIDGGGNYFNGILFVDNQITVRTTNTMAFIRNGLLSLGSSNFIFDVAGGNGLHPGWLEVSANVVGSGGGFRALGDGILRLSGTNSYTGLVSIETAWVIAASSTAFGTIAGGVQLIGSGLLELENANIGNETLTVSNSVSQDFDDAGNLVHGAAIFIDGTTSWAGTIILRTNVFFQGAGGSDMTFTGSIAGSGGVWFNHGSFHFEPAPAGNNYSGTTYARCELLTLNGSPINPAIPGPLSVGFDALTTSPTLEVRWLDSTQLVQSSTLTLHSNGLVNLNDRRQQLKSVIFNGGHINTGPGLVSGGGLLVAEQIISNPSSTTALIDGAKGLALLNTNAQTGQFDVADGPVNPDLWINCNIFPVPSTGGLTKRGDGELLLSAAASYIGETEILAGILQVQNDHALGSAQNGTTTVHDGATLQLENLSTNFTETIVLSGTGRGGTNGALYSLGGCTVGAFIALLTNSTIRVDSTSPPLFINEFINGSGSLTKTGPGFLTFGGPDPNHYSGETFVNQGRLTLQKPNGVTAIPSHLSISTAEVVHQASFAIIGSVTVNRGGLWNLNGFEEGFTVSALQGRPPLTLNGGGDVQTGSGFVYLPQGGDVVVNPSGVVNANAVISGNLGLDPGSHHFTVGSAQHFFPPILPELEISAVISQTSSAADIIKDGPGQMRLDRANSFTGTVTVNDGTLTVTNNLSLGSTIGGTIVNGNGSLALDGAGLLIQGEALTMNSSNAAALNIVSSSNIWDGPITLSRDTSIFVSPPEFANSFQLLGVVGGPGGLIKRGPGFVIFAGFSANTYAGLTIVAEGELWAARTATSLPGDVLVATPAQLWTVSPNPTNAATQFSPTSRVTVGFDAVWFLQDADTETIRTLSGPGSVGFLSLHSANGKLTVNNDIDCEFSGSFAGTGSLTKDGSGRLLLSGNSSSFNGTTTVIGGQCRVDGAMSDSPFILRGVIELQGDGIVGDVRTVDVAPLLRPNSKFPDHQGGDLEVGNLTLTNASALKLDFFGPSSIGGNDSVVAHGAVTLDHAFLSPSFHYAPHEGEVITALDKRSSGAISGTFSGLPQNSLLTVDNIACRISYTGGDGNDVTLTVTNLPLEFAGAFVFSGNGNESIDNNECVLLDVWLRNKRPAALAVTNIQLRTFSPNVMVTVAESAYPPIPPGNVMFNSTPFQIRSTSQFVCGGKVQMEIQVTVPGEGTFAIPFGIAGSTNCIGGGACESCTVVSGEFTTNTPTMEVRPSFVGGASGCFPTKACPGADPDTNLPPARFLTHNFTNTTTRELCVTVQASHNCSPLLTPPNTLGVCAYLGAFDPSQLCAGYVGDSGASGYVPFSFRVPAGSNFVLVVIARTNSVCADYNLELFGLPCPPPALQITVPSATNPFVVQWSSAYPDYGLQAVDSLDGPGPYPFSPVSGQPVILNGKYAVTNPPAAASQFFRLAK